MLYLRITILGVVNYKQKCTMDYLKIPLDWPAALKGTLARCTPEESIAHNIMLLIVSHPGEIFGKNEYGSIIWELEFNQLVKVRDWEETVRNSLIQSITTYERRLKDVRVDVHLSEIEEDLLGKNPNIRRQANITIHAQIESTDIPFVFNTLVYISPLSQ